MLSKLIAEGRPLLADGATGTNLIEAGLASGECAELWNETHPDRIRALHRSFVDAGADIILTNSFGANRRRLGLRDLGARARELSQRAAQNARAVADRAGRPIVVAGSVGPTGEMLAPLGPLGEDEATAIFVEQIEGLRSGGADVVWIETMSAPEEARAAARAAIAVGAPYTATASFDTAGRTMMGLEPAAFARAFDDLAPPPLAIGANCGVGAADLVVSVLAMTEARPDAIVIAKANAGLPQWRDGRLHYSGSPELMGRYAALAIDAGARIVGGCCGTTPAHIAAMRDALGGYRRGLRPDLATIEAALGKLVAPPAAKGARRSRRGQGGA
ncbi:MAG: betaine--homocysteine S-methyltransferase [Roseiarcus sp.]